ncbi:Os07g0677350 [Oryza sativa Japonica Group]|uniref:Os07g0677350 protein n=1 Tax=Oryza sativa subsp. japonica TaxID=39947 RepID=A0A0P0XAL5_ORYSJ|nr:hypothetical protein EE612_041358 [Oryza sativa]BAT03211.1 Os07g0677350 [Oryza sativa Japonica Group]
MLVSLYSLVLKPLHRAIPIVCAPERATKSVALSPLLAYALMSCARLSVEGARLLITWAAVAAPVESLLPSGTLHDGPPSATTESRAATVRMSAQETVCLHTASICVLMLSMTS